MYKHVFLVLCVVISARVIDKFVGSKISVNCQCKPEESLFTCTCQENSIYLSRKNSHQLKISDETVLIPKHVLLSNIEVIKVHGVNITTLSNIFPKTLLNNLTQFHVEGCSVKIIDPDAFEQISRIQELHMLGNALQDLSWNTFQLLKNLTRLILTRNLIQQIPERLFDHSLQLTEIDLDNNNISKLPDHIFDRLMELQALHLEHNSIEYLNNNLFINNLKLKELKISYNKIQILPTDLFKNTKSIVQIHLNDNNIQTIPSNIFSDLKTLNVISMQNNSINKIKSPFYKNEELSSINLNDNELSFIPQNVVEESNNLKYINLENNHLICNCTMRPFYKEIKKRQIQVIGRCEEPMEYRNFSFNLLPDEVFACPPKIQDFTYKENETIIEFVCVIQSDLSLNITLFHEGNVIPEESIEINSISTTYSTRVMIFKSSDGGRGVYKCFATNEKGQDQAKLNLISPSTTEQYYNNEEYWDSNEYDEKVSVSAATKSDPDNQKIENKCDNTNKGEYLCELHNKHVRTITWNFKLQNVPITHIIVNLVRNTNCVTSSLIVHGQTPELSCQLTDVHKETINKIWNNVTAMEVSDTNFLELKFYVEENYPFFVYDYQGLNCTKSRASCENYESETCSDEFLNITYTCAVRNIETSSIFWIPSIVIIILLAILIIMFFIIKTRRRNSQQISTVPSRDVPQDQRPLLFTKDDVVYMPITPTEETDGKQIANVMQRKSRLSMEFTVGVGKSITDEDDNSVEINNNSDVVKYFGEQLKAIEGTDEVQQLFLHVKPNDKTDNNTNTKDSDQSRLNNDHDENKTIELEYSTCPEDSTQLVSDIHIYEYSEITIETNVQRNTVLSNASGASKNRSFFTHDKQPVNMESDSDKSRSNIDVEVQTNEVAPGHIPCPEDSVSLPSCDTNNEHPEPTSIADSENENKVTEGRTIFRGPWCYPKYNHETFSESSLAISSSKDSLNQKK